MVLFSHLSFAKNLKDRFHKIYEIGELESLGVLFANCHFQCINCLKGTLEKVLRNLFLRMNHDLIVFPRGFWAKKVKLRNLLLRMGQY